MKKFLLITVLVIGLLTFACIQSANKINEKENGAVKIQFASWGSKTEVEIIKGVIADFETSHPKIKVEFLHIPQNYFQKIHLLFASNTEPDVLFLNNQYLPIYANAGKLLPLSVEKNVYGEKVLKAVSWHDEIYAVPRDISVLVVYFNKDLFRKSGLQLPRNGWKMPEFLASAKRITEKTGMFGVSFEEEPLFYLPYLMSEGGSFFELESPEAQKALNFYADLRNKYHIAPRREESASATMAQMFLQGKIAMQVSGRWLTPKYLEDANFPWGIVTFPAGAKGSIVPLDASGWAISKSSKHKEEAQIFIDYLSSKEVIEKFSKTGLIVPARNDVEYSDKAVYSRALKTAKPTPVTVDYNKVLDNLKIKNEKLFN